MPRTRHGKGGPRSPQRHHRSPSEGGGPPGATSPHPLRTRRRNDKSRSNSVSQAPSHHQFHIPSQQQHNGDSATHSPSQQPVAVSATINHHHQRVVPPPHMGGVMKMSPEAKLAWNLKILKRHDSLISRIYDQCPYGVLYTFVHAVKNMEFEAGKGRKYEGHWEKTNIEGTVFIIERSAFPYYGFFLLNRGGTSSIVQMFHENDTIEVGADTKFLTFRPGLWGRATTPYEEPFTRCAEKPELICLWLSDEAAGPRFARFILRVKERLAWMVEHGDRAVPMTPLSQVGERSESDLSSEEDSPLLRYNTASNTKEKLTQITGSSSQKSIPTTNATAAAAERPLDKLFASLLPAPSANVPNLSTSMESRSGGNPAPSETEPATSSVPNRSTQTASAETTGKALLETLFPKVPVATSVVDPVTVAPAPASATSQPQPHSGLSLLDAIFASARASETGQPNTQVVNANGSCTSKSNSGQVAQNVDQPVTPPHRHRHEAQQEAGASVINVDSPGDSAPAPDRNTPDARANGVHYPPTVTTGANPPSRSRNHFMSKTSTPIPADVFNQLEAPSPSIIPNPYHTPKPAVLSRRQRAKAKFDTMQRLREEGQKSPSERTIASPSVAQNYRGTQGHVMEEGVLSIGNSANQTMISREVAAGALVSSYNAKHNERVPLSSSAPIGKFDFVNGILNLIHEERSFVDDLYNRYRASLLQQQQQQQ